jgi:hypothetical protein
MEGMKKGRLLGDPFGAGFGLAGDRSAPLGQTGHSHGAGTSEFVIRADAESGGDD